LEEKSLTFTERASMKMELTINEPLSFSQIYDLKKVRAHINQIWRENRELYDFVEKARMYALLTQQEQLWTEFWETNQYRIGYKLLKEFFEKLKYRECAFCGNPFSEGKADKKYCSDNCRVYACRKEQRKK